LKIEKKYNKNKTKAFTLKMNAFVSNSTEPFRVHILKLL